MEQKKEEATRISWNMFIVFILPGVQFQVVTKGEKNVFKQSSQTVIFFWYQYSKWKRTHWIHKKYAFMRPQQNACTGILHAQHSTTNIKRCINHSWWHIRRKITHWRFKHLTTIWSPYKNGKISIQATSKQWRADDFNRHSI